MLSLSIIVFWLCSSLSSVSLANKQSDLKTGVFFKKPLKKKRKARSGNFSAHAV